MGTLRDQILGADDLPREKVDTDEWAPFGVPFVFVRGLTASERDAYEQTLVDVSSDGQVHRKVVNVSIRAGLAVRVIVDEAGERVFTNADVDALGAKSAAVLDRVCDKALELSGMKPNPTEDDQAESSSSDSPLRSV